MGTQRMRRLVAKGRDFLEYVPFGLSAYFCYWKIRSRREAGRVYPQSAAILSQYRKGMAPSLEEPSSQLCTAGQFASPAYERWCREMRSPARFSRKQWEFVYILETLWQAGVLRQGANGLGFGCGREPIAAIAAKYGATVLATDLSAEDAQQQGWVQTLEHSANLDHLYLANRNRISRDCFFSHVSYRSVDMNQIPEDLGTFDFIWSACALEHLGSIRHGIDFIRNSSRLLKPGGIAVHTTEFNLSSDDATMETPGCSLLRRQDIIRIGEELAADGVQMLPVNFNCGEQPLDNHVDLPPYGASPHLKLQLEGYVVTSIGMIIKKQRV